MNHKRVAELTTERLRLHEYIKAKLEEKDYISLIGAALDAREIDIELKLREEIENENVNRAGSTFNKN